MEKVHFIFEVIESSPFLGSILILLGFLLGAIVIEFIFRRVLLNLTRKTDTTLDDDIVTAVRKPIYYSLVLIGLYLALKKIQLSESTYHIAHRVVSTLIILLWTAAFMRCAKSVLTAVSKRSGDKKIIQSRTIPLFEIAVKFMVVGGALYAVLLAWSVDITAWLASAGIVGIAVGFAAKDTLANFFSGIFIIADAPYKLGDWIVLDSGERGQVTEIGIRSTRILTKEDIQIIVPNASIGSAKIINETSGPHMKRRVGTLVGVAYDSDVDKVREVMMQIANECPLVVEDPAPRVRFRSFGDSALNIELLCWIDDPVDKGKTLDQLNTEILKKFRQHKIVIAFPQREIRILRTPGDEKGTAP